MVENAIQYDVALWAIRGAMNVVDQLTKRGTAPKSRVNIVIVLGIVFVVRGRGKDGVQIKDVDPKRFFM